MENKQDKKFRNEIDEIVIEEKQVRNYGLSVNLEDMKKKFERDNKLLLMRENKDVSNRQR